MKRAFKEAICTVDNFCDFKVVLSNSEIQKEICKLCGRRIVFNIIDGRIDNERYRKSHIRTFCQPVGRLAEIYELVYGSEAFKRLDDEIKRKHDSEEKIKGYDYDFDKAIEGGKRKTFYNGQTKFN